MFQGRLAARNRVVLSMILPILLVGLTITVVSVYFWTKPVISFIEKHTETELELASDMGIQKCEERLDDLLSLRLENDHEMVESARTAAIQQVLRIQGKLDNIHLIIVEDNNTIVGSSVPEVKWEPSHLARGKSSIIRDVIDGSPVRMHYRYFPFWNWHIISYIHEDNYTGPIDLAKRMVYLVCLSVLLLVTATVFLLFEDLVNKPLKRIIHAAEGIAQGRYNKLKLQRQDEIGQVAQAFDTMVQSLEEDKDWIQAIMSKLKESEERYRLLTENSLANIMMIQDGRFIYANRATIAVSGYSADELYRMEVLEFVHPDDRELVRERILGWTGDEDLVAVHHEFRYLTKQGETRWLEMMAVPSLYKGKTVMLGHAMDITDRVIARAEQAELEKKLQQAQKMEAIGAVVGAVAHDLNNILAGVVGYPDLLLLQIPEGNPLRKYILPIQESGQRAAAIVQDLLTMVRKGVVVKELLNLNSIIDGYLRSPEFEKMKKLHPSVAIEANLQADLFNICGSLIHLRKTLANLVLNAAEASPEGGVTRIETLNRYIDTATAASLEVGVSIPEGEYTVLCISDQGVGIPKEDLARIFEPFYTKKVMGRSGTGLGMPVVLSTVQDHAGYISIHSVEGQGTRFELYFPATRENLPEQQTDSSLETYRGSETLLIVDDVKEQREVAREMLGGLGYKVNLVPSGEEAVEFFKKNGPVDLLILDMIMDPGIDGLETYRRIIALRPGQKAIIASGYSETERVRETQRLGAHTCIVKPFTLDKLASAVRKELDRQAGRSAGTVSKA